MDTAESVEAYVSCLRAAQLLHERTESTVREANALFQSAVEKDPSLTNAYVGLARSWLAMGFYEDSRSCRAKAEAAARKATELAPESADAHQAMAEVHSTNDKFEDSRMENETAIRLNPNLAEGHSQLGTLTCTLGRLDEGIAHYKRAWELDPLSLLIGFSLSHALRTAGRIDEALVVLGRLKELHPRNFFVYDGFATLYLQTREFDRARDYIDAGLEVDPNNNVLKIDRGCLFGYLGQRREAEDELEGLMSEKADAVRDYAQFYIRIALGDLDEAFEALMRMAETHTWFFLIKYDPLSAVLTKDPRFREFCMKVGIPP